MRDLFTELKRRKVIRVAVVYMATAFVILQAADIMLPRLGVPEWAMSLVVVLVVLGFPLALVLAWALELTPEGVRVTPSSVRSEPTGPEVTPDGVRRAEPFVLTGRLRRSLLVGLGVGVVAVSGVALTTFAGGRSDGGDLVGTSLDAHLVAVLPFRVNAPEALSYLGAGFMDLLAARLDGEVGPRAIDPGAVVTAASRETNGTSSVARSLGAGLVLTGSIVGGASSIVVSAELSDVADGSLRASASSTNHPDSLTVIADRLIVQLLSLGAGEYTTSIATLTSTSPGAVRAYLRGRQAFREGRYMEGIASLDEALAIDSAFALAAIAREDGATNALTVGGAGGLARAWRHRDRLGPRDLMYLEARLPQTPRTGAENLAIFERLTREQPDRVEAWYWLGEHVFHAPGLVRDAEWAARVRAIFGKTLELDPGYFPAVDHLILLELKFGTPEQLRSISEKFYQRPEAAAALLWPGLQGIARGEELFTYDIDWLRTADGNGLVFAPLWPIFAPDQTPDDFVPYVEAAFREARNRAGIDITLALALQNEYEVNLAMGRPARAEAVREERIRNGFVSRHGRATIYDAVWDGVAPGDAAAAVRLIDDRIRSASGRTLSIADARDLTAAEVWRNRLDPARADVAAAAGIRGAARQTPHPENLELEGMALLIEAWAQARARDPRARTSLDRLVAIIADDPGSTGLTSRFDLVNFWGLLAVAAIHEEIGDFAGAVETLDRAPWNVGKRNTSPFWREQGRLAALAGDTDRALLEYRRWLKLHADAEPSVIPEVEAVRAEVERLEILHSASTGPTG